MSKFVESELGSLLDKIIDYRGKTPTKLKGEWAVSGIPAISAKNVKQGRIVNRESIRFVNDDLYSRWMKEEVRKGDILMTSEAPLGETYFVKNDDKLLLSQRLFAIRTDKEKLDSGFLFYYFNSKFGNHELLSRATGTTVGGIRQAALVKVKVRYPENIVAQKQITSILSAYDDLIENNEKRIKMLEEMASRLYTEWFVKFKFSDHEKMKMVDSGTGFGMIPEGWEVKSFGDVVSMQYGYTASAEKNNDHPKYLRGMDINKRSFIDWDDVPNCKISEQDFKKYKIRKGDVFIIRMADPGKIGICEREVNAVFASYLMRFNVRQDITPYYLYYFVSSERYQGFVVGASGGTTRKSVNSQQVVAVDVLIPKPETLNGFETKVGLFRRELTKLIEENNFLSRTRDLLIPQLVTGKREVK